MIPKEFKVVAFDFDGTLFTEKYPDIGEPIYPMINLAKYLKKRGVELILYTNREGRLLDDAVESCRLLGLEFDAVNENLQWRIDLYGDDSRKIGADLYIDDKAINADTLLQVLSEHPCKNCDQGWGTINSSGEYSTCHFTCSEFLQSLKQGFTMPEFLKDDIRLNINYRQEALQ